MTDEDIEKLCYCLEEMIEGHFRTMRAFFELKQYLEQKSKTQPRA